MNEKIMIGSIGAVIIIVLAGFTSVVGVQTNENSIKMASPLFGVRTQSAIRTKDDVLTTASYVGEGKTKIYCPVKGSSSVDINAIIDKISEMTDREFEFFINYFIKKIDNNNKYKNINNVLASKLKKDIINIKEKPNIILNNAGDSRDMQCLTGDMDCPTNPLTCGDCTRYDGKDGLCLELLLSIIIGILLVLIFGGAILSAIILC